MKTLFLESYTSKLLKMGVLVQGMCILICLQIVISFKIQIDPCKTSDGHDGYCRPEEDCYGVNSTLSTSTCKEQYICCPKRTISEEMCNKYAEYVFSVSGVVDIFDLSGGNEEKEDNCYISSTPLIVGGEQAGEGEFPHMAALGFGKTLDDVSWMCGGSLISEYYILTAAHCSENHMFGDPKFVKLGTIDLKSSEHVTIPIEKIIRHPKYANKLNDISLVKLLTEVEFTNYIRPACLDYSGIIKESTAMASGFGVTEDGSTEGSQLLMKVQLDIVDKPPCAKAFKRAFPNGLIDSILCAGVLDGGKDTCQGDSGGPLVTVKKEPYCMYNLIGVTSFGRNCGYAYSPAIYSRVFSYIPWIESIVWPDDSNDSNDIFK